MSQQQYYETVAQAEQQITEALQHAAEYLSDDETRILCWASGINFNQVKGNDNVTQR